MGYYMDLMKIKSNVVQCKVSESIICGDGILRYQGRLCVPNFNGLRERVMVETHEYLYAIHPSSTKLYHDL